MNFAIYYIQIKTMKSNEEQSHILGRFIMTRFEPVIGLVFQDIKYCNNTHDSKLCGKYYYKCKTDYKSHGKEKKQN